MSLKRFYLCKKFLLIFFVTSGMAEAPSGDSDASDIDVGDGNILGDPNSNDTCVFTIVAFRNGLHGVDKGSVFNENYHEEDITDRRLFSDLTKRGKIQEYKIGKYLRERYEHLFNGSYSQHRVRMYSGPKNRSMASAALVLAGMFPPDTEFEIWDEHLGRMWQPIPIHINSKITDTDGTNVALEGACLNLQWILQSEPYLKLKEQYDCLITFLCEISGKTKSVLSAMSVASNLMLLDYYPGSEPEWANETIRQESINYFWDLHAMVASFHAVQRLSAGWILADFVDELKAYMGRRYERKFVGWSLHVDNQNALLVALNNFTAPKQWPPLGAFMSVEMHYINESYQIRAFYWNRSYTEPTEVMIQNCSIPGPCTLEKFEEWTRNFFVEDWGTECGQTPEKNKLKMKDVYNKTEPAGSPKSNFNRQLQIESSSNSRNSSASADSGLCLCAYSESQGTVNYNGVLLATTIIFGLLFLASVAYTVSLKRSKKSEYMRIE